MLAWQFCLLKDRTAAGCFCVVCAVMWCVTPAECKSDSDNVSPMDGGEEGRFGVFRWSLHQWLEMKQTYIYVCVETWWSERRDIVLGTCWNTASHQVRPQPLFVSLSTSSFDFSALLSWLCSFTFQVFAQTVMEAAICTLITQFKQYAGKDGSSSTLSKDEFHSLVTSQLPNYVQVHPQHMQTLDNLWFVNIDIQTFYSCMVLVLTDFWFLWFELSATHIFIDSFMSTTVYKYSVPRNDLVLKNVTWLLNIMHSVI